MGGASGSITGGAVRAVWSGRVSVRLGLVVGALGETTAAKDKPVVTLLLGVLVGGVLLGVLVEGVASPVCLAGGVVGC